MTSIAEKLPTVRGKYKFNEPLNKYTWLGVGGPAEVMFLPEDEADLQAFLQNKPEDIPVFMIGNGSNLLIGDKGIKGVTIKLQNKNFSLWKIAENKIYCGAGLKNFELKKILPANKFGGLEFLCSIPGSLGGAVHSNAGCFGSSLSDVLLSARIMNAQGEMIEVPAKEFNFAYRKSEYPKDWIILELCMQGCEKNETEISSKIKENEIYRKTHQPQGIRTAGSTFKNPEGYRAWELIKKVGGDTLSVGGAHMSEMHCNFLENNGTATASQIEELCNMIIDAVYEKFSVKLELEINKVGQNK